MVQNKLNYYYNFKYNSRLERLLLIYWDEGSCNSNVSKAIKKISWYVLQLDPESLTFQQGPERICEE